MPLYILDGLSTEIIARRLRTARNEWAMRIGFVLAWAIAMVLAFGWMTLAERRSAARRSLAGQAPESMDLQ